MKLKCSQSILGLESVPSKRNDPLGRSAVVRLIYIGKFITTENAVIVLFGFRVEQRGPSLEDLEMKVLLFVFLSLGSEGRTWLSDSIIYYNQN